MQSRSAGGPQSNARLSCPQAVVGWPAACQLTWRRRVQADYFPSKLSVRRPLPPCRRLEHQATNHPTRTPPGPSPASETQRHPSSAHATHTGTAVSPSRVCHRGVRGLSAVQRALIPQRPGAPNPAESCRDGCADRGFGRPGVALTQIQTPPPPPPPGRWNQGCCTGALHCTAPAMHSTSLLPLTPRCRSQRPAPFRPLSIRAIMLSPPPSPSCLHPSPSPSAAVWHHLFSPPQSLSLLCMFLSLCSVPQGVSVPLHSPQRLSPTAAPEHCCTLLQQ